MVSKRIEWIDTARGIGIILVVYGHVLRGLQAGGLVSVTSPIWLSDYAIYTFHMPLFFVLAGFNVERSIARGRKQFVVGKLWTIAYPYLLWSAIQGGIQLYLPSYVNHPRSPLFLLTILRFPIAQFWFLYALFFCHMLALLIGNSRWLLVFLAFVAYGLNIYQLGQPTSYAFGFYVLGIVFGDRLKSWAPTNRECAAWLSGIAALFTVCEHFGRVLSGASSNSIYSLPATLAGIALVCVASQVVPVLGCRIAFALASLGVMSMTIYILHVLAATSARILLKRLGLTNLWMELTVGVVAGVGLPVGAHLILERFKLLTALGLAPLQRLNRRPNPQLPEGQALA